MNLFSVVESLLAQSGFAALTWQQAVMIVVSFVLMYMAIVKKFEPLLLLPISFGMFLTNLPLTGLMEYGAGTQTFSEGVLGMGSNACVSRELFPLLLSSAFTLPLSWLTCLACTAPPRLLPSVSSAAPTAPPPFTLQPSCAPVWCPLSPLQHTLTWL